jgi:catechol 2,3-dioxygenase-like lactoylglutathione lyase family enzyme
MADDEDAKKLMADWDAEHPEAEDTISTHDDDDDDDEPLHYDEMLEQFRREVYPGDNELDHIVLGVRDLDKAIEDFEKLTGHKPLMVVSLNGMGTKSARISFEEPIFIEIVGPDPKQENRHLGAKLAALPEGEFVPFHWAVRCKSAAEKKKNEWKEMGLECDQVTMVAKDRGMPWKWDMYILQGHESGGLIPYFCDWKEAKHASGRLPIIGNFGKVTVSAPSDNPIHKLLDGFKNVEVETGSEGFTFQFNTASGTHKFSSSSMIGVTFPM